LTADGGFGNSDYSAGLDLFASNIAKVRRERERAISFRYQEAN